MKPPIRKTRQASKKPGHARYQTHPCCRRLPLLRAAAVLVASVALLTASAADETDIELLDVPLKPKIARQCFQEAQRLCEKDAGRLWGVSLYGPILFADPKTRAVIASQADREGLLTPQDGVFVGTLPPEETIAGTAKHWAGVTWVMLPWPLPKDKRERMHFLTHEMFHRIQPKLGLSAAEIGRSAAGGTTTHLDTRDGRVWMQLEWRALQGALKHSDPQRRRAVIDALIFRAYRRALFPNAAAGERAQETAEGLAEYTGVRMSADSDSAAIERALLNFERAKSWPTLTRSFAYVSGPAYGLLLDRAKPDWRNGLSASDDLGELLRQALSLDRESLLSLDRESLLGPTSRPKRTPPETEREGILAPAKDLEAAANERAKAYGVDELVAAETARETAKRDLVAEYRQRFLTGPVLIIPIRSMQFQFDPRDIRPLDDLGKVYPKMKMSDAWGILEVTGGALIANDWSKVVVPAPPDPTARPLTGPGWTLTLNPGWLPRPAKRHGDYIVKRK
jgi:hypothetical protein